MKKKFAIVFLSLFLVVSLPFAAHANIVTATGKYLINTVKHIKGGAKVEATNVATGAKHVVTHGVSAPALGTAIGAGIVGGLVSGGLGTAFQLITGVALDAVDWVMDKENNQIKWKEKGNVGGSGGTAQTSKNYVLYDGVRYYSPIDYCRASAANKPHVKGVVTARPDAANKNWVCYEDGTYFNQMFLTPNPDYDPSVLPDGYKSLPLVDLSKKVIEQADGGNVDSQKTIEDYVTNLAKEGKLDAELDASTDITKPDEPTKPDDKDKDCPIGTTKEGEVCVKPAPDNVPLFCNQSDFTRKICDWIDWTQEKPDDLKPDAGKVDVIDKSKDLTINENRIDFSNQCPPPTPINLTVMGFGYTEELSYQPMCDFFAMLNPFIVGMGGISSALIIAGGVRRG